MPPLLRQKTMVLASQTKLWTRIYHSLRHSSFKLDLDNCLTPEAKNRTDLNYSLYLNVWDGHNVEGSGTKF